MVNKGMKGNGQEKHMINNQWTDELCVFRR